MSMNDYESIGNHWVALYINAKNVTYLIVLEWKFFQTKLDNSLKIKIL